MTKLYPSTNVARDPRTYTSGESMEGETESEDGGDAPDIAGMEYRELQKLAGETDGISGRQSEETLREQLTEHYL